MGGVDLSLNSFLIMPFTDGQNFLINYPMWFIAPLFFAEVLNMLVRVVCRKIPASSLKESCIFSFYLILGAIAIQLGGLQGLPDGGLLLVCRTFFFLACFGMGSFYANVLEKRDTASNVQYFAVLFGIQLFIIVLLHGGYTYIPSVCKFPGGILGTYAVTITGIAFLLRCCKLLAPRFGQSRLVLSLADNTFSIMCHHIFGFFLLCSLFAVLSVFTPWFNTFDMHAYLFDHTYKWMPATIPQLALLYVVVGIAISLIIHFLWEKIKQRSSGVLYKIKTGVMH